MWKQHINYYRDRPILLLFINRDRPILLLFINYYRDRPILLLFIKWWLYGSVVTR